MDQVVDLSPNCLATVTWNLNGNLDQFQGLPFNVMDFKDIVDGRNPAPLGMYKPYK